MVALPNIELSYGSDLSTEDRAKRIAFGDAYSQRGNEAINTNQQIWRLLWNDIPDADAETLRTFFEARKGTEIIDWTPIGQATQLKFTSSRFTSRPQGFDNNNCSVVLTQEFDL